MCSLCMFPLCAGDFSLCISTADYIAADLASSSSNLAEEPAYHRSSRRPGNGRCKMRMFLMSKPTSLARNDEHDGLAELSSEHRRFPYPAVLENIRASNRTTLQLPWLTQLLLGRKALWAESKKTRSTRCGWSPRELYSTWIKVRTDSAGHCAERWGWNFDIDVE